MPLRLPLLILLKSFLMAAASVPLLMSTIRSETPRNNEAAQAPS